MSNDLEQPKNTNDTKDTSKNTQGVSAEKTNKTSSAPTAPTVEPTNEPKQSKRDKIINIFQQLIAHLTKKRFWIPLLIGHLLMFASIIYLYYDAKEKRVNIELVLEQINTSLLDADAAKINSFIHTLSLATRLDNDVRSKISHYPDFNINLPDLPNSTQFVDQTSIYILDLIRSNKTKNNMLTFLEINPKDVAEQIHANPFVINQAKSIPEEKLYFIETNIKTINFGTIPLVLSMEFINDTWKITSITSVDEILAQYDSYYRNQRFEIKAHKENEIQKKHRRIEQFIKNPVCSVNVTTLVDQTIMLVQAKTDVGNGQEDVASWGINVEIKTASGQIIINDFFKTTGLYNASKTLEKTWRIDLTPEQTASLQGQENAFTCTATPTYLNLANGEFYDFSKKQNTK